ncbi:MAG: hypothetical protein ACYC2R_13745 [Burkholderiales bacterium]
MTRFPPYRAGPFWRAGFYAAGTVAIEGRLYLTVKWDGLGVQSAELASTRPVQACHIFRGKTVAHVVAILPLLFSVCRLAQSAAALQACQQALGTGPSSSVRRTRQLVVLAETAQEYLWRFSLDWPQLTGAQTDEKAYAQGRVGLERAIQPVLADAGWKTAGSVAIDLNIEAWQRFATQLARHVEQRLLGIAPLEFLAIASVEALEAWCRSRAVPLAGTIGMLMERSMEHGEQSAVPLMPAAGEMAALADALAADDGFAQRPQWRGGALETGALARMQGHPLLGDILRRGGNRLLARVVARLLELAALPQRIQALLLAEPDGADDRPGREGLGQAWVETARGLLLHRVEVAGEVVRRYQILAPTEWNFHPGGVLVDELRGVRAADEGALRKKIAMAMLALDPCVGYELRIEHA